MRLLRSAVCVLICLGTCAGPPAPGISIGSTNLEIPQSLRREAEAGSPTALVSTLAVRCMERCQV